ncbi:MAG TPA: hypothetical protein VJ964_03220 [Balneolaceae bacterium]|nr:hypothetical protein [Balneolaceae bacterium]
MKHKKNIKSVLDQFLDGKAGELEPASIPLTQGMRERLEPFAQQMDITIEQAASFLLWAYLVDIERTTEKIKNKIFRKN